MNYQLIWRGFVLQQHYPMLLCVSTKCHQQVAGVIHSGFFPPGWRVKRAGFTCSPPTVAGWGSREILGTTLWGGGWACWTGWPKPTQCGCCWRSARRRPVTSCSNSHQGWGGGVLYYRTRLLNVLWDRIDLWHLWFCGAGVPGQEVDCAAEEGFVCATEGGAGRNSHQPPPCQREPVQWVTRLISLISNSLILS